MPRAASSRRYAQATFQIALERGELDAWLYDLMLLASALDSRELSDYLDSPQVPVAQKVELIKNTLGDSVSPLALNLVSLLASRGISYLMPGIVEQYQQLLDAHQSIERAEVISAVPLDDSQQQKVAALLGEIVETTIKLNPRVDPSVLGGFVAKVGDRVIDGSTRTKLRIMRQDLVERR